MTSKISYFKIAIEDLRRRLWMLALSCLGSFLALPVAFLLANRNYLRQLARTSGSYTLSPVERMREYYMEFFTSTGMVTQGTVLTAGAVIVAVFGFRYLYSRKMVDLYHSVPVKRSRLFLVTYINGLLIWLLPMLTALGITLVLMLANMISFGAAAYFGAVAVMALRHLLVCIVCFLIFYHFCLVCVMLSGNAFNALYSSLILGTAVLAVYAIIQALCDVFLDTYVNMPITWDQVCWASPLVSPFYLMADFSSTTAGALFWDMSESLYSLPYFMRIATLLVMVFNFLVARKLYLKRPSELAEHGVDHKRAQSLIRLSGSIIAGLFGGLIFLWIVDQDALGWQLFGILLCGTLAFGITDIILHMNFKSFFAHKRQMVFSIALSGLILLAVAFDLTGFDRRLPARNHIEQASILISGFYDSSRNFAFDEEGIRMVGYINSGTAPYSDIDTLYPLLERATDTSRYTGNWVTSVMVSLDTSFGPFVRRYQLTAEDLDVVRPIVESDEYRETFYTASSNLLPRANEMHVHSNLNYNQSSITDTARMQELMDAYTADFLEYYTMETLDNGISVGELILVYQYERSAVETLRNYSLSLPIYSHFTKTIEKVKEYYPEMVLYKEDLHIASIEIRTDTQNSLNDFFRLTKPVSGDPGTTGKTTASADGKPVVYEITSAIQTMAATAETIGNVTISDPEEIEQLLPHLMAGDHHENAFASIWDYKYIGQLRLTNGSSIGCYVDAADLPLTPTKSIEEYAAQNP